MGMVNHVLFMLHLKFVTEQYYNSKQSHLIPWFWFRLYCDQVLAAICVYRWFWQNCMCLCKFERTAYFICTLLFYYHFFAAILRLWKRWYGQGCLIMIFCPLFAAIIILVSKYWFYCIINFLFKSVKHSWFRFYQLFSY